VPHKIINVEGRLNNKYRVFEVFEGGRWRTIRFYGGHTYPPSDAITIKVIKIYRKRAGLDNDVKINIDWT
jgi:hypothetical protein